MQEVRAGGLVFPGHRGSIRSLRVVVHRARVVSTTGTEAGTFHLGGFSDDERIP